MANVTAAFVAGSSYMPAEEAVTMRDAVVQRYLESGSLLGSSVAGEASLAVSLKERPQHWAAAHANGLGLGRGGPGGRWGLAHEGGPSGEAGAGLLARESAAEMAVRGRILEREERLYHVMMMEAAEARVQGGVGAGWLMGSVAEEGGGGRTRCC